MKRCALHGFSSYPLNFSVLIIQVDTEAVEIVHTFNPTCQSVEDHSYPRPGKKNANSVLKLLVLKFSENQQAS